MSCRRCRQLVAASPVRRVARRSVLPPAPVTPESGHQSHARPRMTRGLNSAAAGMVAQRVRLRVRGRQLRLLLRHLPSQQRKHHEPPGDHTLDRDVPLRPHRSAKRRPLRPKARIQHPEAILDSPACTLDHPLSGCRTPTHDQPGWTPAIPQFIGVRALGGGAADCGGRERWQAGASSATRPRVDRHRLDSRTEHAGPRRSPSTAALPRRKRLRSGIIMLAT